MPSRIREAEDYRPRPNRRTARPRTKTRPDYPNAVAGVIISVDRGRFRVVAADHLTQAPAQAPIITCVRASHLRRTTLITGDEVSMVGDTSGAPDTLARIVELRPRRTILLRSADDTDPTERVVVANADTLVVVSATQSPEPSWGLIDRALTAALSVGITPIIAVTKTDLSSASEFHTRYAHAGITVIECGLDGSGTPRIDALIPHLSDRVSVLLGHSGVGKSTLINQLAPGTQRDTGGVNAVTGRGRHTSSSALAIALPAGGWAIDTPGVRSFGLAHVPAADVISAFTELAPVTADCPRGCTHLEGEPGCVLDEWVASGAAGPGGVMRLASLRRLLWGAADATRTDSGRKDSGRTD